LPSSSDRAKSGSRKAVKSLQLRQVDRELIAAAKIGTLLHCFELIVRGARVNAQDPGGMTALHWASYQGNVELMRLLIANGADVMVREICGRTALYMAASGNQFEACVMLAGAGVPSHEPVDYGNTALHCAVLNANLQLVKFLVGQGARSDVVPPFPEDDYLTPFQNAVQNGEIQIVEFLAAACSEDPGQKTIAGSTLSELALNEKTRVLLRALATDYAVAQAVGRDADDFAGGGRCARSTPAL
jgi:ankyrin repeat protein